MLLCLLLLASITKLGRLKSRESHKNTFQMFSPSCKEGGPAVTPPVCSTTAAILLTASLISSTIKRRLIECLSGKNLKKKMSFHLTQCTWNHTIS